VSSNVQCARLLRRVDWRRAGGDPLHARQRTLLQTLTEREIRESVKRTTSKVRLSVQRKRYDTLQDAVAQQLEESCHRFGSSQGVRVALEEHLPKRRSHPVAR
jgi:hypothetical protein